MQDEQLWREEEKEEGVQMSASRPISCFRVPSLMVTCTFLPGTVYVALAACRASASKQRNLGDQGMLRVKGKR